MSRCRGSVPAALLAAFVSHAAPADLVGLGAPERALLEANPILERIARERPEALGEILDRLNAPERSHRRGLETLDDTGDPGDTGDPDDAESGILDQNPDLADFYRESPEAALDLLRLIREATKEK